MREWEYIGEGRNRAVYRHGNYVVKVPLNVYGVGDNYHEYHVFRHPERYDYCSYARCRLMGQLLIMQYARFVGPLSDETGYIPYANAPKWADTIDCNQIGYNRFGQIVAYDYGLH